GGGIGHAVCLEFAKEGAIIAACDVDIAMAERTVEDVVKVGGRAHPFVLDVTDPVAVSTVISAAKQQIGNLEVLINNAGVREIVPVLELSYEEWSRVINVNITGVFLCAQAFAREVIASGGNGSIVNLASTLGVVASPSRAAYTASKHAVVGLTKEMAMEFGEQGIRVNAVGPGVIRTPLTERYFQTEENAETIRSVHALNRWGQPPEVAKAIAFLASDDASFCTGTTLMVDGGWTAGKKL
ncbi:MAG: SDR family oxidoreductase, partial [Pseudomonadota bacterium]|nr:SDR family oxidoreductase [Pseudomonadota bacterium]